MLDNWIVNINAAKTQIIETPSKPMQNQPILGFNLFTTVSANKHSYCTGNLNLFFIGLLALKPSNRTKLVNKLSQTVGKTFTNNLRPSD